MTPTGPQEPAADAGRPPDRIVVSEREDVPEAVEEEARRLLGGAADRSIGLATGETFRDAYRFFDERQTLVGVRCFMLDEYVGLSGDHLDGFAATLCRWLPGIDGGLARLDGTATEPDVECARYERMIETSGPIDLQLVGVGVNGHIAFNEPGSAATSRTRVVTLTEKTRERNLANMTTLSSVPTRALTQGVGTILDARMILVVATGAAKRVPLRRLLDGPPGADVPLSWLRLHPAVTVIADLDAIGDADATRGR